MKIIQVMNFDGTIVGLGDNGTLYDLDHIAIEDGSNKPIWVEVVKSSSFMTEADFNENEKRMHELEKQKEVEEKKNKESNKWFFFNRKKAV